MSLFLLVFLHLQLPFAFAAEPASAGLPVRPQKSGEGAQTGAYADKLSDLEEHFYRHNFSEEPLEKRLDRLEKLILGVSCTGSVEMRLKSLGAAAKWPPAAVQLSGFEEKDAHCAKKAEAKNNPDAPPAKESYDTVLNTGIAEFRAQRYHHAQSDFEKAILLRPHASEAYANLAGTLLVLGDRQGAREAFKACYALQPFGRLGEYARYHLLKLARSEAYEKTGGQDSPRFLEQALKTINRQTAEHSKEDQARAAGIARYRVGLASNQIARLTDETQQELANLRALHGHHSDPYVQELTVLSHIKTNHLRRDGSLQADSALASGLSRSTAVYDSSARLKEQILRPSAPGGARLRALGTSLYARYYGDGMPSYVEPVMSDPPPVGLQASAKSLSRTAR